ncbi:NUDIX hydrolase domain-like protein [Stachybotrys elegans]|uniref:NUDIX hydrolase domain-like protein n=1 Tax=Stachybotrys elegans TaxID=80388 RepID=A0A8K0SHZ1_9HYPO|nr:NUDIX hydrolase domain-like protein [Stachybotrys elegans]
MASSPPTAFSINPVPAAFLLSKAAFLAANPHITNLMAGAIVFHPATAKTLLIRRAPTDTFPLKWEVPGGSVDATDAHLAAAAVRELWEETGLSATAVLCAVGQGLRDTPDGAFDRETGMCTFAGRRRNVWGKATFVVDGGDCEGVVLRPKEHVEWAWVTEDEVREGRFEGPEGRALDMVSEGVTQVVLEAFRLKRETNGWKGVSSSAP